MNDREEDAKALDCVVRELRDEEPAARIDWARVESGLLARIDASEAARRARAERSPRSPLPALFGFAAAAAVAAFGVGAAFEGTRAPRTAEVRTVDTTSMAYASGTVGAPDARDLLSLREGDAVEAGESPIAFGKEGVVTWILAPGSRIVVRSLGRAGVGHVVALERGSLRAEVTPRSPSEGLVEAFAVEVEQTRLAVHGTAFSVTRSEEGVILDVEHGAVAVGPGGHASETSGHLVVGPSRALFSLDGGKAARFLARAADPVRVAARGIVAVPDEPAAAAVDEEPIASPEPPKPPPATAPSAPADKPASPEKASAAAASPPAPNATLTAGVVASRIRSCFESVYGRGSSSVKLSVSATLRVTLLPDGTVKSARFDTALRPELAACAGSAIAGRFAAGTANLTIPVTFGP